MTTAVRLPPVLVGAVVLHTAIAPQLRVLGVGAEVLLLVAIAAGIAAGPDRGAAVGFAAGLLADCFVQTPFGLSALTYCIVGWAVGTFQTTVLHAAGWIPVMTALVATALGLALFAGAGAVVGESQLVSARLVTIVGVASVANALLAPAAVRVMRWAVAASPVPGLVLR